MNWWAGSWPRDLSETVLGLRWATWFMRTAFHCSHLPRNMAYDPLPLAPPSPEPRPGGASRRQLPTAHLTA